MSKPIDWLEEPFFFKTLLKSKKLILDLRNLYRHRLVKS